MLRKALPYLWSSAQAAVLIQGRCWGHLSPIPIRSPALALHDPKSTSRDLPAAHPGSSYSWEIQSFLGKTGSVPVMGDYLYLLKTAPHPARGCSPQPQLSLQ